MADKYKYIKSFETCGLKLRDAMGGGILPGLHDKAFAKVQKFFEDAAVSKNLAEKGFYKREWVLTDKPSGEKYPQKFMVNKADINAYLAWKDHPDAPNAVNNFIYFFGDFMVFWGGASQIGLNMGKVSQVIRTALPMPHKCLGRWILDGYNIMHYDKSVAWDDREKTFRVSPQTPVQQYRDMEELENLELELGHSIPHHEIRVNIPEIEKEVF
jgi:hypothetical protein